MQSYTHERRERTEPDRINTASYPTEACYLRADMKRYLDKRGLDYAVARTNDWYPSNDAGDDSPRIVIPATTQIDRHKFWQARAMDANPKRYQSPFGSRLDAIICVYADGANHRDGKRVLVEGPMDALAAAGEGYDAIALMGVTPNLRILSHVAHLTLNDKVLFVADSDAVGQAANVMASLASLGVQVRLACASKKDLAAMDRDDRAWTLEDNFRIWAKL